jgi:hypothetical protein
MRRIEGAAAPKRTLRVERRSPAGSESLVIACSAGSGKTLV